ncbi:MAG: recombinase family protein [Bacilli bacterium]|jgi:resolvase, N-terminal domain protein|nr:recombinase family protein [Bacilli bacterium]HBJ11756.1 recombinase family protein [Clostridiales bacterium]
MKKAGLYCRVSTDIQMEGYSIDAQKDFLKSYCKMHEIDNYEFYIDGGYSGSNINRPDMQRLIEDVEDHKIDIVVVFKLDRLSRSQKDTLYLIEEVFNPNDCGFVSIKENFDTNTPFGKAMVGILSVFAQLERETILERTRIGRKKRAEEGLWYGTGNLPFAYDYDEKKGILVPNKEKVEIVNKMVELYLQGMPMTQVGALFGLQDQTVRSIFTSPVGLGKIPYKDEIFEGQHEPIMTQETYDKLQQKMKERAVTYKHANYLLAGKIVCGKCGAKYRYQKAGTSSIRLYCYSQQTSKKNLIKDANCDNRRYYDYEIEDYVIKDLISMSLDESKFRHNMNMNDINVSQARIDRIAQIDKQVVNLLDYISEGIAVEETKEKIRKLQEEKEKIQKELSDEKAKERKSENLKVVISDLNTAWKTMTFEEQRNIVLEVIDKVVVNDNEIQIYYNI